MPAVARVDPKTVFTPQEWSRLTSRSSWRGMWLVMHAWGTIVASIALVTIWPNPLDLVTRGDDCRHAPARAGNPHA
jgi:hypothetical protein